MGASDVTPPINITLALIDERQHCCVNGTGQACMYVVGSSEAP